MYFTPIDGASCLTEVVMVRTVCTSQTHTLNRKNKADKKVVALVSAIRDSCFNGQILGPVISVLMVKYWVFEHLMIEIFS